MKNTLDILIPPRAASRGPLTAQRATRPVNFVCVAMDAEAVYLVGDFNEWNPVSHPMKRQVDGTWTLQLPVPCGYQHYRFLVDGVPTLDPRAYGTARDDFGEKVSLLSAS